MSEETFPIQQYTITSSKDLVLSSQEPARNLFSYEDAARLEILPMSLISYGKKKILIAATTSKNTHEVEQTIRFASGYEAQVFTVSKEYLQPALFEAYHRDGAKLVSVCKSVIPDVSPQIQLISQARDEAGDAGKLLKAILDLATAQHASDIQLTPRRDGLYINLRVMGERKSLNEVLCSLTLAKKLINRIKVIANLDLNASQLIQDGSFEVQYNHELRSARVNLIPTIHGTQVAIRLFGSVQERRLEELFVDSSIAKTAEQVLKQPSGLVVVSGTTGSGKTTTLYSFMHYLVSQNLNVISLEDPVEAEIKGVSQTGITKNISYAAALKAALRQDPDAILVGEIRDAEVASIACEAALTGHLVLTTMHAGNVKEAIVRFEHLARKQNNLELLQALRLVICQKLVPELCTNCKVLDLESSKKFSIQAAKRVGCHVCDYSGFGKRLCIVEALQHENFSSQELQQDSIDELEASGNFFSPKKQLLKLFASGRIGAETLMYDAFDSRW